MRLASREGKPLSAAVTLAGLHDARGELSGLLWRIRPVTDRKRTDGAPPGANDPFDRRMEACAAELRTSNEQLRLKLTELERVERAVEERLRFETLLSQLSTRFLNLPPSEVDRQIEHGLQHLAEFLEVDRSTLFEFSHDMTHLRATHSWTVAGCEPAPAQIAFDQLPWATSKMLRGDIFLFSQVSELPDKAARDKAYLRQQGPKSAVVIPLTVAGASTGAVSFTSLGTERPWSDGVVQRLRLVGEIFSNALSRKQADASLHKAFAEIKALQQRLQAENLYLREEIKGEHNFDGIIGQSDVLKSVLFRVEQVAPSDTTVLILGETGVGKELLARAIHQVSPRSDRPMVKVSCATLPANLIESELFGHEKGAYSGAEAKRVGRFEVAHGGTLFLDEIGELPLELQTKLLRVLQDGEFERLGSSQTSRVDVRVIAATNRDMEKDLRSGRFRKDLYYRLHVFPITVPPLRDRREDIPLLVRAFVERFARKSGKTIDTVPPEAQEALERYPWPGNVRELQNVIERAVINTRGSSLRLMDTLAVPEALGMGSPRPRTLAESEAECIVRALEATHWKIEGEDGAAKALGVPASTLRHRMKKHGIHRSQEP
ncbi:Formate hydrogenlyase transcriptional activator [Olavius algarvensis associated proteobacterium Delta 3]|nr:Formate hydrogenlyase transcriptional activator [Olavius algarvensis associated proteobacterium Delta 3]